MTTEQINPATGEAIDSYSYMDFSVVETMLHNMQVAQHVWKEQSFQYKAVCFRSLATLLRAEKESCARMITREMGKAITESFAEVEKCATLAEYLAEHAESWLKPRTLHADGKKHELHFDPLGIICLVMPWNFPFWQPLKVGLPPLLAGNAIVLKHAKNVSGSSLLLERLMVQAGFPKDIFRSIIVDHSVLAQVIAHPAIAAGSLTGSEKAGSIFAAQAGKQLKKVVMELGGSDVAIVCKDADIPLAAKGIAKGRMMNAGQVCIATKRILVHQSIEVQFLQALVQEVRALRVGDPEQDAIDMGPLVNEQAVKDMESFVEDALNQGAHCVLGGKRINQSGAYFEPTILTNVTPNMRVMREEVFGPIAPVMAFTNEEEAITVANNSTYGLSATVWTRDMQQGERIAKALQTGSVFINSLSKTDPRLPVGGIKNSGFGRELSEYGIREFVNIKTINVYS